MDENAFKIILLLPKNGQNSSKMTIFSNVKMAGTGTISPLNSWNFAWGIFMYKDSHMSKIGALRDIFDFLGHPSRYCLEVHVLRYTL